MKDIEKSYIDYFKYFCEFPRELCFEIAGELFLNNKDTPKDIDLTQFLTSTQIALLQAKEQIVPFLASTLLIQLGFSTQLIDSILGYFGRTNLIIDSLKNNPYMLTEVEGVSFKKVDKIALEFYNISEDSPLRQKCLILHVLNASCAQQGHLFISLRDFYQQAIKENLQQESLKPLVNELVTEKKLIFEGEYVYSFKNFEAEQESAKILAGLINNKTKINFFSSIDADKYITGYEEIQTKNILEGKWKKLSWTSNEFKLSLEQKDAVKKFLISRLLVLTGLPGSGKTSITKVFVDICKNLSLKMELLSPTGIAAKKLSSTCDYEARTIHKALKYNGYSCAKNDKDQLDADVFIIDEFSMVDQQLLYKFLKALPTYKDFILVLVGDHAQLPSVAPGNVLRELISNKAIPHSHLDKVFRQEDTSDIIINSYIINSGSGDLVNNRGDFIFQKIEREEEVLETVVKIATKLKDTNHLVLSPTYKGLVGVDNINRTLQDLLNPIRHQNTYKNNKTEFRVNDKIMIIKNDYRNEIYNGEQGIITSINYNKRTISISINSKRVEYYFEDSYNLIALDYCRTIHKSQSQEYDYIVLPLVRRFYVQLQRNLLYTAVTRAKKKVFIIGHQDALMKAITNNEISNRNTLLNKRISTFLT